MDRPVIDHRGLEFSRLASEVPENLRPVFQTTAPVIIYPITAT
jgi:alanine-glyoxylate transaminase/serine-glyoxylate transaminase/serine-pyruvate transaminase